MAHRLLLLYLALISLLGCSGPNQPGPVSKELHNKLRIEESHDVDLAKLTTFGWDELFMYGPYMLRTEICKQLGISESDCRKQVRAESSDDGEMVLIFRKHGKIVHTELHFRINGDFLPLSFPQPLTPQNARFAAKTEGESTSGKPWMKLTYLPTTPDTKKMPKRIHSSKN